MATDTAAAFATLQDIAEQLGTARDTSGLNALERLQRASRRALGLDPDDASGEAVCASEEARSRATQTLRNLDLSRVDLKRGDRGCR